jgi:hypothetical protein
MTRIDEGFDFLGQNVRKFGSSAGHLHDPRPGQPGERQFLQGK